MININTNIASLMVQTNLRKATDGLNNAVERISNGFEINHAKDNAANYSIVTNISTKLSAYQIAEDNASMGLDMLETSSHALAQMENQLVKLRTLALNARNGTNSNISALNEEAIALTKELCRISETTEYNGIKLFNTGKKEVSNSAKELKLNDDGFLLDIVKRDTSSMTKLADVNPNETLAAGTYSISTKEELILLTTMSKASLVPSGVEIVLADDIDLQGVKWDSVTTNASFDGNGYTIKNLTGNNGLFLSAGGYGVKNVKLENVNITSSGTCGGVCASGTNITNCTVTGKIKSSGSQVGGIVGYEYYKYPSYCYTDVEISGKDWVGGIAGALNYSDVRHCVSKGKITGNSGVGGIVGGWNQKASTCASYASVSGKFNVGGISGSSAAKHNNCYFAGNVSGEQNVGGINGNCENSYNNYTSLIVEGNVTGKTNVGVFFGANKNPISINKSFYYKKNNGNTPLIGTNNSNVKISTEDITIPTEYYLQVGINSDSNASGITLTTFIDFSELTNMLESGLNDESIIEKIDSLLNKVLLKQTEVGTGQNRLTCALEEISMHYDTLISTRSTLKDADIGNASSSYIKNQILQNAASTLLATANQTPSIALQLI